MEIIKSFVVMLILLSFCIGILNMLLPDGNIKKVCILVFSLFFIINVIYFIKNINVKAGDMIEKFNEYTAGSEDAALGSSQDIMLQGVTGAIENEIKTAVLEFIKTKDSGLSADDIKTVVISSYENEKAQIDKLILHFYKDIKVDNTDINKFIYDKYHIEAIKVEIIRSDNNAG